MIVDGWSSFALLRRVRSDCGFLLLLLMLGFWEHIFVKRKEDEAFLAHIGHGVELLVSIFVFIRSLVQ